jgi:transposase
MRSVLYPTIDVLQLAEAVLREPSYRARAGSVGIGEASRAKDRRPSGQASAQERGRGRVDGGARQVLKGAWETLTGAWVPHDTRDQVVDYVRLLVGPNENPGQAARPVARCSAHLPGSHVGTGFKGSYYTVRRFVRRLEPVQEVPLRRLECEPGEEAQVDFGTGTPVITRDGKRRRTHVFRIVLSHSRKAYSEAVYRQTTDEFLRCIESAFRHFGGAPRWLVLDNLKAAVKKADWFDPELNPKIQSFGEHYGFVFWPTRPRTPRHKGKVEKSVDYVQSNALKARRFASLEKQNIFLLNWELTFADTRIHSTTRRQVGKHFIEVERTALVPLPLSPFPSFQEGRRTVHRDGHVEVKRAYYAAPPEYLARDVWVRWNSRLVRVFNDRMEQIAVHPKQEPGRFSTPRELIASKKISGVEQGAAWLLRRVTTWFGPRSTTWAEAMIQARGVEGVRVLIGLLSLAGRHSTTAIKHACEIAHSYGGYHLRTIRALLKRQAPKQDVLPFVSEHPMIRPMSKYGQFVHDAFQSRNERTEP